MKEKINELKDYLEKKHITKLLILRMLNLMEDIVDKLDDEMEYETSTDINMEALDYIQKTTNLENDLCEAKKIIEIINGGYENNFDKQFQKRIDNILNKKH